MTDSDHKQALPPGYELRHYRLLEVLGVGGFGITYLGQHVDLEHLVAVKEYLPNEFAVRDGVTVYPKSSADKDSFRWGLASFVEEARTLTRFRHPNLVRVLDYFEANGAAYIVMDYEDGEPLDKLLERRGTLTEAELLRLLSPLVDGLREVHAEGFLHRDVKPSNVIVRRSDETPVLVDFGAARNALGHKSKSMTAVISPGYSPPEQYEGDGNQGPWTDIYALSALCHRAISGTRPIEAPRRAGALLRSEPDPLSGLTQASASGYSQAFLDAVNWGLRVVETERPQNLEEWLAWMVDPSPRADPESTGRHAQNANLEHLSTRERQRRKYWFSAAGLAIASTAAVGVSLLGNWPGDTPGQDAILPVTDTEPHSERAAAYGTLTLELAPPDAIVTLPNVGPYRPGMRLQEGHYQVVARRDGYAEATLEVLVPGDTLVQRRIELSRLTWPFTVTADPSGAIVKVLDVPERYHAGMPLIPGDYRTRVSADGYVTRTVTVTHGASPTVRRIALRRAWVAGEKFRDQLSNGGEGPLMVVVPPDSFSMGSPMHELHRQDDEGPVRQVTFGRPFAMGVYEVTFEEWGACLADGGCLHRPGDRGWGHARRPVVDVSWMDARAYVDWLSRKTNEPYRLPSEAEWEYAARAGTPGPFHTGSTISTDQANYDGNYAYGYGPKGTYRARTVPVGSFSANEFGLHDMHGNVWEWVEDCWNGSYEDAPTDGAPWLRGDCDRRVWRGGSWYDSPNHLRSANRGHNEAGAYADDGQKGLRVARTITP